MLTTRRLQVSASPKTKELVGTTGRFFEVVVPEWWTLSTSEIYLTSLMSRRRLWFCMWPVIILVVWFLNWQGAPNAHLGMEVHALHLGLFLCMTIAGARLPLHTLWSDVFVASALAVHLVISAYWSQESACYGELQWVICLAFMGVHTTVLAGFLGVVHVVCLGLSSRESQMSLLISASAYIIFLNALLELVLADQNATLCGNEATIATLLERGDGICIVKRQTGEVFKADSRFCEFFGEACVGTPFLDLIDPEERNKLDPVFKDCSVVPGEPIKVTCTHQTSGLTARLDILVSTSGSSCVCSVSDSRLISPACLDGVEEELSEWDLESCHSHSLSASSLAYSQATSALSQSSAGLSQGSSVPRMGPLATQLLQGFSHRGRVSDQIRRLQLDAPRAISRGALSGVGRAALGEAENLGIDKGTQTVERKISRSVQTVSARRAVAQAAEAVQAA